MGTTPDLVLWCDNQAAGWMIETGNFKRMRHVERVHDTSLKAAHEWYERDLYRIRDCHTNVNAADIFTKSFTLQDKWQKALLLIGIISDDYRLNMFKKLSPTNKKLIPVTHFGSKVVQRPASKPKRNVCAVARPSGCRARMVSPRDLGNRLGSIFMDATSYCKRRAAPQQQTTKTWTSWQ